MITADSDQIPTVQNIKSQFPKKNIKVYFPPERKSTELLSLCKPVVYLGDNEKKFSDSIMPATVTDGSKIYTKPASWSYSTT